MLQLFRRAHPEPLRSETHLHVAHEGETYKVLLKRVQGARRFTLRVRNATRDVLLTMPQRGSLAAARDFSQRHAAWIAARLSRLPMAAPFRPGILFPFRGDEHMIIHHDRLRGGIHVEAGGENSPPMMHIACHGDHLSRRLHDFLRREAKRDLEEAVCKHAAKLGFASRKVSVRDTTSRWGSCSASGSLNFSWRLIMAPPDVLDYLAAHEVAHLVHMNHSDEFWSLTRELAPHTDRAEAWLRAHGSSLYRFGVETD